jgi:hypothetical protein
MLAIECQLSSWLHISLSFLEYCRNLLRDSPRSLNSRLYCCTFWSDIVSPRRGYVTKPGPCADRCTAASIFRLGPWPHSVDWQPATARMAFFAPNVFTGHLVRFQDHASILNPPAVVVPGSQGGHCGGCPMTLGTRLQHHGMAGQVTAQIARLSQPHQSPPAQAPRTGPA